MADYNILVDLESEPNPRYKVYRVIYAFEYRNGLDKFVEWYKNNNSKRFPRVVQVVDKNTGETIKGPKYDTTTQEPNEWGVDHFLHGGIKQQKPLEPTQHEPRDRFQENKAMDELKKFRNIIKECLIEIKRENNPRERLKESLRGLVRKTLNEMSANVTKPEPDTEEKEIISKQYNKKGNERLDKTNEKQFAELESLVHGLDPKWEVYIDDHNQFVVRAQNLLYVRVCPKFENNYDVDAMVKLVDRVRAISLTWEQVKKFIKANFGDLKNSTNADRLHKKSIDNEYEKGVNHKSAGPDHDIIKNRGEKKNGEDSKIKDTKKDDKDYNEKAVKKDEDQPDQPMKNVTKPGEDPEGKNHKIDKTDKVKPPKFKNDKKLRASDKKTPKFVKKQVNP